MKKIISVVIVVSVIGGFFTWLYGIATDSFYSEPNVELLPPIEHSKRLTVSEGSRTVLSKDGPLQISDITIDPVKSYEGAVVVFAENDDFSITFFGLNDQFLISLKQKSNFAFARTYAEQTFLKKLNITQNQACSLAVDVVIPPYIDFNLAGSYGLSFCPGAVAVPSKPRT